MRSIASLLLVFCLAASLCFAAACSSSPAPDAGTPEDAGSDAGQPDSGPSGVGSPCNLSQSNNRKICPAGLVCAGGLDGGYYTACEAPAYVVDGGVVTDTLTGLNWEQLASSTQYSWDAADAGDTASAQYHCANLPADAGWRMPTLVELYSLVEPNGSDGGTATIGPTAFPGAAVGDWWTSSQSGASIELVNFTYGSVDLIAQSQPGEALTYVRCVH